MRRHIRVTSKSRGKLGEEQSSFTAPRRGFVPGGQTLSDGELNRNSRIEILAQSMTSIVILSSIPGPTNSMKRTRYESILGGCTSQ